MIKTKIIFLDRDGVINEDLGFIHKIEDFKFISGVFDALKILHKKGFEFIIITNQSGIGRGYYSEEDFLKVNDYMLKEFEKNNIKIKKVYYCKHSPEENCKCRKPKTKFIEEAIKDFNVDINNSWCIGDKLSDIEMGEKAGCKTILIDSKYVKDVEIKKCKNLLHAVEFID